MIRTFWVFLAVLALSCAATAADVAAQFRNGPSHTGEFAGQSPGNLLGFVWKFHAPNRIVASPVAAGGTLYIGDETGTLYALDRKTGTPRWRFAADAGISATVAVDNGTVFFQSDANTIYAVRAADGGVLWSRKTGPDHAWVNYPPFPWGSSWDYWRSSPLAMNGTVYIGSGDGFVYALDAASGALKWRFETGNRVRATPAGDGRTVYAGSFDGTLYALDAAKGRLRWKFKTSGNADFPSGEIQSSPALAGGLVLFGSRDYNLYAIDAKTGREVWRNPHEGSWVISTPAVSDGRVVVGSSDGQFVRAVDLKTGKALWTVHVGINVFASAAITGGTAYIGTLGGQLLLVRLADGKRFDGMEYDGPILSSAWIDGGVLFIATEAGDVYALTNGAMPKQP